MFKFVGRQLAKLRQLHRGWLLSFPTLIASLPTLLTTKMVHAIDIDDAGGLIGAIGGGLPGYFAGKFGGRFAAQKILDGTTDLAASVGANILDALLNFMTGLVTVIFNGISYFLAGAINLIIGPTFESLFAKGSCTGGISSAEGVANLAYCAWNTALDVANVLFFLALLIASVLIILRYSGYNLKKVVTSLIVVAIFANISYDIARILIFEIGGALSDVARSIFGSNSIEDIMTFVGESWGTLWSGATSPTITDSAPAAESLSTLPSVIGPLASIITSIILAWTLFRIAWVLIERSVRLLYLTVVAPIMLALSLLPTKELQGLASQWWSEMIKWIMVLPVTLALLSAAMTVYNAYFKNAVTANEIVLIFTEGKEAAGSEFFGNFLWLILMISLILSVGGVPKMLGVGLSAITESGGKWLENTSRGIGKYATKEIGASAKATATDLGFRAAKKLPFGVGSKVAGYFAGNKMRREGQANARKMFATQAGTERLLQEWGGKKDQLKAAENRHIANGLSKHTASIVDVTIKTDLEKAIKDQDGDKMKELAKKAGLEAVYQTISKRVGGVLANTKLGIDVSNLQAKMFAAIGKDVIGENFNIGFTPDEIKDSLTKAMDALAKNDTFANRLEVIKQYGTLRKTATSSPNKEFRDEAKSIHDTFVTKDNQNILKKAGFPFGTSPLGKVSLDTSNFSRVTDAELKTLAEDQIALRETEEQLAKIKRDLKAIGDADVQIALNVLENLDADKLAQLHSAVALGTDTATVGLLDDLADNGVLTELDRQLTATDRQNIDAIRQDTGKTQAEQAKAIDSYLKKRLTGQTKDATLSRIGDIAKLLSENHAVDPTQLSTTQAVSKAASVGGDPARVALRDLVDIKVAQKNKTESVLKIQTRVDAETKPSDGFRAAQAAKTPSDALLRRMESNEKMLDEILSGYGASADKQMQTLLSSNATLKDAILQDINETGASPLVRAGQPVSEIKDLDATSYRELKEFYRKYIRTARDSDPEPTPSP